MPHKELLAKIEVFIAEFCEDEEDFCDVCSPWKALRAVANLHQPNEYGHCLGCPTHRDVGCYLDNDGKDCPTIQIIEENLL